MPDAAALAIEDVVAGYGGVPVLNGVSVAARPGTITAVLGANGAGKTTLLRTISGLVRPRQGRILVDGTNLARRHPEDIARAGVAHVPEGRRRGRDRRPGRRGVRQHRAAGGAGQRHTVALTHCVLAAPLRAGGQHTCGAEPVAAPAPPRTETGVFSVTVASSRKPSAGDERPPGERLLSAAEQLLGERSYRRTSVADICAKAGIATGSFYAHFRSKADIFAAVVRRINADLRAAMGVAIEQAPDGQRARERASFRAFFDMLSQRPWIDRIVRESEFVDPGLFREYYERLARGYARGVRRAQLAGEVDAEYDPEVIAYLYTGVGNFIGMRWADWTAGGQVPADVMEDLLNVLDHGLPPRP